MHNVQFIKSPSGEELAVIPREEYERLAAFAADAAEDEADAMAYREAKAEWIAEGQPVFPPELSALLLSRRSRLAAIRKWRGMRQAELAERVGLSQGFLSDIEGRRKKTSQELIQAMAKALDVPETWLTD